MASEQWKYEQSGQNERPVQKEPEDPITKKVSKLVADWQQLKDEWVKPEDQANWAGAELENQLVPTLVEFLHLDGPERNQLYEIARGVRDQQTGHVIQVRGVIEVSNICRADCLYCPMRKSNLPDIIQVRATANEIYEKAQTSFEEGIRELFIQSGEDVHIVPTVIQALRMIRANPELATLRLVLNLGDLPEKTYVALHQAGAEGYLIKHETSDPALHREMRPHSTLESRVGHLLAAQRSGMYIGTGSIVGLPGQTDESLARDILFAGRVGSDRMVSCSPFTPSEVTPLAGAESGDFYKTLNMTAVYRLLFPTARIPAVSNLDNEILLSRPADLEISGQSAAVNAGANGITINITPPEIRDIYAIYESNQRRSIVDFAKAQQVSRETGLPLGLA